MLQKKQISAQFIYLFCVLYRKKIFYAVVIFIFAKVGTSFSKVANILGIIKEDALYRMGNLLN